MKQKTTNPERIHEKSVQSCSVLHYFSKFYLIGFSAPKLIYFFSLLMLSINVLAQSPTGNMPDGNLPVIIPPSPEVSELSKFMDVKTQFFTGASNIEVPLYNLKTGNIGVNVSLNYSNNGIKVTDIPGRAGLGWNVLAGGSISRTVHDEPDELSEFLEPLDFDQQINDADYLAYLRTASRYGYDTEHDIYNINVAGLSGKFFFDETGMPQFISHSNCKIEITGNLGTGINTFIITDAEGIKYYFGENGIIEKTREVMLSGFEPKFKVQATAWFLTRIESPEGDQVTFNYNSIYFKTNQGPSQYVVLQLQSYQDIDCGVCNPRWGYVNYTLIDYDSYYLAGINTSNGRDINFQYETRPDLSGDVRLTGITSTGMKRYTFNYLDVSHGQYEVNKKFFLTNLYTTSKDVEPGEQPDANDKLTHTFKYFNPNSIQPQTSFKQDYYGYHNDAVQGTNFFPKIEDPNYSRASEGADRNPKASAAKTGAIQMVIYPTGGSEQFEYEPHTMSKSVTETIWQQFHLTGTGIGSNGPLTVNQDFHPMQDQTVSISFTIEESPGAPDPSNPDYNPPNGTRQLAEIEVFDVTNNQRKFLKRDFFTYGTNTTPIVLTAGVTYNVRIKVLGSTPHAFANFRYDPTVVTELRNVEGCGIRVSNIKSYDPVSNKVNYRYFTYASLADRFKSSGIGNLGQPNYETQPVLGGWCLSPQQLGTVLVTCESAIGIHGSPPSRPNFNGSPVAYKYVIESDDPDFLNGGIEHEFYAVNGSTGIQNILNQPSNSMPESEEPELNGMERRTYVFRKPGTDFLPIKEIIRDYRVNWLDNKIMNYTVRRNWDYVGGENTITAGKLAGFAIGGYFYQGGTIYLDSETTKEYGDTITNLIEKSSTYQYNTDHTLQTKITTENSDGTTVETDFKYPENYSIPVYTNMVAKNIRNPVIEKKIIKNTETPLTTTHVSTMTVDYRDWFSNLKIFKPELVNLKNGTNPVETKIHYYNYDIKGNPIELSKENGPHVNYIWNDKGSVPIAELVNATAGDIAYTGFEAGDRGGWSFSGTQIFDTAAPGGSYCYNLSSGSLSKAGLSLSTVYIVSYWTKNTNPYSIGGTIGSPIKLKTDNEWSFYLHTVTGVGSVIINISGTGFIDEIRLCPSTAQMKTYSYNDIDAIISSTDEKGTTGYYEYDGFQRLKYIKDKDQNIVKEFQYNYAQEPPPVIYYNTAVSQSYRRNNCGTTKVGNLVTYTVAAGAHSSTVSQADADSKAQFDLSANGQSYANTNGTCTTCSGTLNKIINGVCRTAIKTYTNSVFDGSRYKCFYTLRWPDGSTASGSEMSNTPCSGTVGPPLEDLTPLK